MTQFRFFQINHSPQVYVVKCKKVRQQRVKEVDRPADRKDCDSDKQSGITRHSRAGKQTAEQITEKPAGRKCEVAGRNESRQLEC